MESEYVLILQKYSGKMQQQLNCPQGKIRMTGHELRSIKFNNPEKNPSKFNFNYIIISSYNTTSRGAV